MQSHLLILWINHAEIWAWKNMLPQNVLPQTASAGELGGGVTLWIAGKQEAPL